MESREGNENIAVDAAEGLLNRTGIMLHPDLAAELIQGAKKTVPSSEGDSTDIEAERAEYVQESLPIGSCPSLVSENELTSAEESPSGDDRMAVLLDKLGERLAFERQGTRLYEAFIQKVEAMPAQDTNAPPVENLRHICAEELEHFKLLQQAIVELGGDATVQTPSADVAGVLSHGVLQVMSDPRTTVAQALQAVLIAELADNDGWKMLQELAEQLDEGDLAEQCAQAYDEEQEHLENVRTWLSNMVLSEAVGEDALIDADAEDNEEESDSKTTRKRSASAAPKKSSGSNKKRKK
jgi:rubrerythrin